MDELKIVIRKRALAKIEGVFRWYEMKMGHSAAVKFAKDVHDTIDSIAKMPDIGISDGYHRGKSQYLSVLVHPKYRLIYRCTKSTLYVVALRANQMKQK